MAINPVFKLKVLSFVANREFYSLGLISLFYLVLTSIWHVSFATSGDSIWFVDGARHFYHGSLDIYSLYSAQWASPPRGQTLAYPPFSIILVTPLVALLDFLKLSENLINQLSGIPFLLGDVFCAFTFILAIKKFIPTVKPNQLNLLLILFYLNPFLWVSSVQMGHFESIIADFIILSWLWFGERPLLSGIMIGVAIAFKTTAIFSFLPLVLFQLRLSYVEKNFRSLFRFTAPAIFIPLFAVLPLLIVNPEHVIYAFLGQEQARILWGANIWTFIDKITSQKFTTQLRLSANTVLLTGVFLVSLSALFIRPGKNSKLNLLALLVLVNVLPLFLGKWVSPHYFVIFTVLFMLFEFLDKQHIYLVIAFFLAANTLGLVTGSFELGSSFVFLITLLLYFAIFAYVFYSIKISNKSLTQLN